MAILTRIGKANREIKCRACNKMISVGEACTLVSYKERALSYREALHAGTMYPTRKHMYHQNCQEGK